MPFYRWRGVDIEGRVCKGTTWSFEHAALDRLLLRRGIALIHASQKWVWWPAPLSAEQIVRLFTTLTSLLKAGIYFPDALEMVTSYIDHPKIQEALEESHRLLRAGGAINRVLIPWKKIVDVLSVEMIAVGYNAGTLTEMVELITQYHTRAHEVKKKIFSALLMPAFTFLFVIGATFFIFGVVVPQFELLFAAHNTTLPLTTRAIVAISHLFRKRIWWIGLAAGVALCGLLYFITCSYKRVRKGVDTFLLYVPIINCLIKYHATAVYFHMISLMLKGGMPLSQALTKASECIMNMQLKEYAITIAAQVIAGDSLEAACAQYQEKWFLQDVIALVAVGHEASAMTRSLEYIALLYYERIDQRLKIITQLVQPLLMIGLGVCVIFLLIAIYVPIFDLPRMLH